MQLCTTHILAQQYMPLGVKSHSLYLSMATQTSGMKDLTELHHSVYHVVVVATAVHSPFTEYP